ncbi:MAG: hypothetical protein GXP49_11170 [Deltaproteobacteria bacterium]|nr:hypothetical protein [Deltaproteobacteria bacterium]
MDSSVENNMVVITGIGVISPIGSNKGEMLDSLIHGRSAIASSPRFEGKGFRTSFVAEVPDLEDLSIEESKEPYTDRCSLLSIIAAKQALVDSGLEPSGEDLLPGAGLVLGTCNGGMLSIEKHYRMRLGMEKGGFGEDLFLQKRYFGPALCTAGRLGISGPCSTVVTACSASLNAIGVAMDWLKNKDADIVLAGGADALSGTTLAGFDGLKTTCPAQCAPFSFPLGLNLGEGAAYWVLENQDHATRRGAKIYGCLLGYGLSTDAYHPTSPDPRGRGLYLALKRAVTDSGIDLKEIEYVNAHGTGTEANDKAESNTLRTFFNGKVPPVSSLKSYFGHTLGAAGILEATGALLCLSKGFVPATLNFNRPRPGCNLDYVPNEPRPARAKLFLSEKLAFGGHNCAMLLSAAKVEPKRRTRRTKQDRVFITGTGLVSGLGFGSADHVAAYRNGSTCIGEVSRYDVDGCALKVAGLADNRIDSGIIRRLGLKSADLSSKFAGMAVLNALDDAGLKPARRLGRDLGLVLGLTIGPTRGESEYLKGIYSGKGPSLLHFPFIVPNSIAGNISRALSITGTGTTLCTGPGSGLMGVINAVTSIHMGRADIVLAGGVDEVSEVVHRDFDELGLLGSSQNPRPLGEGAAMVVLESESSVRTGGSGRIKAEVLKARSFLSLPVMRGESDIDSAAKDFLQNFFDDDDPGEVGTICVGSFTGDMENDPRFLKTLFGPEVDVVRFDRLTGSMLSAGPLVSLGCALHSHHGRILCLSCSRYGELNAVLLEVPGNGWQ